MLDVRAYKNEKVMQLQLLLYYLPFCETLEQKFKIESEILQIKLLITNAKNVYLLKATIESKMNALKITENAESLEQ